MSGTDTWIDIIAALSSEGDYDAIRRMLDLWRAENPAEPIILLYDAALAYTQKDYAAALDTVDKFLAAAPQSIQGLMLKYTILLRMGDVSAKGLLARAASLAKQSELWRELGELLLRISDLDGAIGAFRKAIAAHADCIECWSGIGLAYLRKNQYDNAENAFNHACHIAGDTQKVFRAGTYELLKGNLEAAKETFEFFAEYGAKKPIYWLNYGLVLFLMKDYESARTCWHKALQLNPNFAHAYYNLACLSAQKGDYEASFDNLKTAVELSQVFKRTATSDSDLASLTRHPEWEGRVKGILGD